MLSCHPIILSSFHHFTWDHFSLTWMGITSVTQSTSVALVATVMRLHISIGLHHAAAADDDDYDYDENENTDDQNVKDASAKPWRKRQLLLWRKLHKQPVVIVFVLWLLWFSEKMQNQENLVLESIFLNLRTPGVLNMMCLRGTNLPCAPRCTGSEWGRIGDLGTLRHMIICELWELCELLLVALVLYYRLWSDSCDTSCTDTFNSSVPSSN